MLVFLSDVHLTDGSSGETISSGAFNKFTLYLTEMAENAEAKEVDIVLLGDIFDVIRSDHWLRSEIRPWSDANEKDGNEEGLQEYTAKIVANICGQKDNEASISHLKKFKEDMAQKDIEVTLTYVVGNHDWLINRYPETREKIADFLGMDDPARFRDSRFPAEEFWSKYKVKARHGDIYDPFNFDGNRDASSLGDAIVIDLLNGFPKKVENEIGPDNDPGLITELREIDNIRPLVDIPLWIQGACRRARTPEIGERVKGVWNDLVEHFLDINFVKAHDKAWRIDIVDALQLGLRVSKYFSFSDIANLPLRKFQKTEDSYIDRAFNEEELRRNEAEYVVYGHTHRHIIEPLDRVPMTGKSLQKTYFNTGTWRKIHRRAAFDKENQEFLGWKVMTFISFYLDDEREDRNFEVWCGALG
jgi:UDP-2,3-diacylglucosamine pyrophosphatase LpxH